MWFFKKRKAKKKAKELERIEAENKAKADEKREVENKATVKKEVPVEKEASVEKVDEKQSKGAPAKYHVSQNNDEKSEFHKQWRVRKGGSKKTIKYFNTQAEAIEYADHLAEQAGSSIVIHKMDGKIRKQDYSKK